MLRIGSDKRGPGEPKLFGSWVEDRLGGFKVVKRYGEPRGIHISNYISFH